MSRPWHLWGLTHPNLAIGGCAREALRVIHLGRGQLDTASRRPQKWGEMGWILESNRNMNRAMEAMGGRIVRRFRVYGRPV